MLKQALEKLMEKTTNPQSTKNNTKTLISLKKESKASERNIPIKSVISLAITIKETKVMSKTKD